MLPILSPKFSYFILSHLWYVRGVPDHIYITQDLLSFLAYSNMAFRDCESRVKKFWLRVLLLKSVADVLPTDFVLLFYGDFEYRDIRLSSLGFLWFYLQRWRRPIVDSTQTHVLRVHFHLWWGAYCVGNACRSPSKVLNTLTVEKGVDRNESSLAGGNSEVKEFVMT